MNVCSDQPIRGSLDVCSAPVEDVKKLTLITAIKTPYLEDGRFDLTAFDELTNLQIQNGVEGLIVGGTTGEGHLMNWEDHIMLIGHAANCFGNKIKVIGKHSCSLDVLLSWTFVFLFASARGKLYNPFLAFQLQMYNLIPDEAASLAWVSFCTGVVCRVVFWIGTTGK